jgi:hypothetical protein
VACTPNLFQFPLELKNIFLAHLRWRLFKGILKQVGDKVAPKKGQSNPNNILTGEKKKKKNDGQQY